jgi:hypothetical protein
VPVGPGRCPSGSAFSGSFGMATLRGLEEDDYEAFWKELEREELGTGAKPPEVTYAAVISLL